MKEFALNILYPSGSPIQISNPEGLSKLNGINAQSIISTGVSVLILFAIITTLIFLVWGGIDLILAQGEKQNVTKAREKLTFAIIGMVVVLSSFLIMSFVSNIFGIDFLKFGISDTVQHPCLNKLPGEDC